MQYARSLLFMAIFYPGTLLFSIAGLLAGLVGTQPMRAVVHSWAEFHHWLCVHVLGVRSKYFGVIPPGQTLIAVKHQSMYETIEMLRLARTPVVVLKRELADIPLFGWITRRYGVIPVDRSAGAKELRAMLVQARQIAMSGRPIVIFPEGTRVRPGDTPPLRPGFSGLYTALGLRKCSGRGPRPMKRAGSCRRTGNHFSKRTTNGNDSLSPDARPVTTRR